MPSSLYASVAAVSLALVGTYSAATPAYNVSSRLEWRSPALVCVPLGDKLPAVNALVDSAALVTQLHTFEKKNGTEDVVSVSLGAEPSGRLLNANEPSPLQDLAVSVVMSALRPATKDSPKQFRVRINAGVAHAISVERSVVCQPTLEALPDKIFAQAIELQYPLYGRTLPEQRFNVRMRVNSDGVVSEVTKVAGPTSNSQNDATVRQRLLIGRFRPATIDGAPTDVWLTGLTTYGIDFKILKTELVN